ncbi:MAG: NADH:flavin oxidoreductase/NADH oxidase [Opitutae bacterium]|nr:NADH:flavin oxidoreductase/NADH oxidase [Opitutae bacterium]
MHLFTPFTLKSVTLRNRVGIPPMCQYSATDGLANEWHLVHYGAQAAGGAALIIVEATAVAPEGRITPGDLGLWNDAQIEPLTRLVRFQLQQGVVPAIQLGHAGRKASCARPWHGGAHLAEAAGGWPIQAPSAVAFGGDWPRVPREMTEVDIARVQDDFVAAARRSLAAGFKWLEVHAAHGYLCHSFLSPLSNRRTDRYGGSFENRIRFLLETVQRLRAVWPENLPLTVRLSCTDWVPGGWDIDECVELARRLKAAGVDLLDCSSGGAVPDAKIPVGPGYAVPFAERIRRETGIATAAVGMITTAAQADAIVQAERADLVLVGREHLRDPFWTLRAARALGHNDALPPPVQYRRAF